MYKCAVVAAVRSNDVRRPEPKFNRQVTRLFRSPAPFSCSLHQALRPPMPMPLSRRTLLSCLLWPGLAMAQDRPLVLEGQPLVRRLNLARGELLLNGAGVRQAAWFKAFVVALYLGQRTADVAAAQAMPGPKRLQLRMLQELPAAEFAKALRKGVARNTADAELDALLPQLERLSASITALDKVRKGDVIDLDLDTTAGMLFGLNGTLRSAPFPGSVLFAAVLRSFIGEHPYDARLKAALMGSTA